MEADALEEREYCQNHNAEFIKKWTNTSVPEKQWPEWYCSRYESIWNRVASYDTNEGGSTKIAWIGIELDLVDKNGPHWKTTRVHRDTFGLADPKVRTRCLTQPALFFVF